MTYSYPPDTLISHLSPKNPKQQNKAKQTHRSVWLTNGQLAVYQNPKGLSATVPSLSCSAEVSEENFILIHLLLR